MLKNAGLPGSNLSNDHITTGFGPFELPTCDLSYKEGGTTPCLRLVFIEEPSSQLTFIVL